MPRASHARPFGDRLHAARSAAPRAPRTGRAIAALLALSGTAACNESRAPFSVEIVSPAGTDPVAGAGSGRLRVLVAQDGQPTRDQGVDLVGGTFQLDVTIASYVLPTRLGVELVRDGVTSIGIPIGLGLILLAIALTGLYVAHANRHHDAQMAAILKDHGA